VEAFIGADPAFSAADPVGDAAGAEMPAVLAPLTAETLAPLAALAPFAAEGLVDAVPVEAEFLPVAEEAAPAVKAEPAAAAATEAAPGAREEPGPVFESAISEGLPAVGANEPACAAGVCDDDDGAAEFPAVTLPAAAPVALGLTAAAAAESDPGVCPAAPEVARARVAAFPCPTRAVAASATVAVPGVMP